MTGPWRALLRGPSWLYGAVVAARNRHYDRPSNVRRVDAPVISVGNLTLGGTGKTPVVAWLARRLLALGRRPAVVSRGYGGSAGRGPLRVSRGDGALCDARAAGDEPVLLAASLHGVGVVVGSDRWGAARAALEDGADVLILDDGFQHRRLARDLDIVLLDASRPLDAEALLPAGRLREPLSSLRRADVVLVTRASAGSAHPALERIVRRHRPETPVLLADHRADGFVDARGRPTAPPARAVAFCGIGGPERFRRDLEAAGVELIDFRAFRDHHVYGPAELAALRDRARGAGAAMVTTEKDLSRLGPACAGAPEPIALRIEVEIHRPGPLLDAVERVLATRPR